MDFDLTKFYTARVTGAQLRGMLDALGRLDEYVKRRARGRLALLFFGIVGWLALLGALALREPGLARSAFAFSVIGGAFVFVTQIVRQIAVTRAPTRGVYTVVLVVGGFIFVNATNLAVTANADEMLSAQDGVRGALIASAFVAYLLYAVSGVRWSQLEPQKVELDFLSQVALPLFADLPKNTRGDLVFNPFRGEWTRIELPTPSRPGYTFEASADILLRLRLPIDEHRDLKLFVTEQTLSKTKNRKSKYKGTKRRVIVRYDMQLAPNARTDIAGSLKEALARGAWEAQSDITVDKARITVVQVQKSAGLERDLLAQHLVPPAQILATVQAMSELSRASAQSASSA